MLVGELYRLEDDMSEVISVFHVGIGVLVAFALALLLVYWYVRDITQKRHTVLRNFPLIGHLRFFFENLGEYFRQYFFLGDREEMPFNRATRAWVYRMAKNEGGILGFGWGGGWHRPAHRQHSHPTIRHTTDKPIAHARLRNSKRLCESRDAARFGDCMLKLFHVANLSPP